MQVYTRGVQLQPETIRALIATAGRAPSLHNSQPWRFGLADPQTIELEVATDRVLPHVDPTGREAVLSCGAALHNLLLALRARGLRGSVTAAPDPHRPLVLASVAVESAEVPTAAERRAIAAIYRRHTHRSGFDAPVTNLELRGDIDVIVRAAGCGLTWVTDAERRDGLIAIVEASLAHERSTPTLSGETAGLVRTDDLHRDGVPRSALAAQRTQDAANDRLPHRFVTPRPHEAEPDAPGTVAVLLTGGDGLEDWLAAGRALQGLLLRAADDWAFARLATPALEIPYYREAVRVLLGTADYPQMILELGHSRIVSTTPRLDPDSLMSGLTALERSAS